jgi:NitT/TauT family transport system substrate-binding protein
MPISRRTLAALVPGLAAPAVLRAQAAPPVRLILDWAPQPHQAPWFLAADRGHFAREGLNVTVERGFGSGDAMSKLAAGTHDVGLGDPNLLMQWNQRNPRQRIVMVFLWMDRGLQSIVTMRGRGITRLSDLAGKRVGRVTGDIITPMWPLFSRMHNIESSRIEWSTVQPNLRDSLLFRGQVDAVTAFSSTSFFNLLAIGARAEDIILFPLAEHGFELFGNGLMVTEEYAERNGETLRRLLRATSAAARESLADVPGSIQAVVRRDQMANVQVETDRYRFMIERAIVTPHVRANGLSSVTPERMANVTGFLAEAFEMPAGTGLPIYTDAFLPPAAERRLLGA